MTVLPSVPQVTQVKAKNKVGRPKKLSMEESDIELDEESTRKRSRSNSVSHLSRNNQKGHENTEEVEQMNSVEIERLKNKLIKVEQSYLAETDLLKNRLMMVELGNTSKTQEIETLKRTNEGILTLVNDLTKRLNEQTQLESRIEALEERAGPVNIDMIDLQDQIEIDTELDDTTTAKPRGWVDVVSKSVKKANDPAPKMHAQQIEVVNSVLYKEREREKRKNNLLIFGLSNEDEDKNGTQVSEKVAKILNSIGVDEGKIRKTRRFRLTAEGSSTPPVFVQMNDESSRNHVLRVAKRLKGIHGMQKVYIKPDQTEAERALEKQLRQRRDDLNKRENEQSPLFRWSIFKGDIRQYRTDLSKTGSAKAPTRSLKTSSL